MDESKLIFIISQPRSGSTLLQKLLSNNDRVDTASEPWILLPLLSVFKPELVRATYNFQVASTAFTDFLKKRNVEREFKQHLKQLIFSLYGEGNGEYFIDKTPRYYEILNEIYELFPNARYVILKRNPMAALHSMIATWSGGTLSLDSFKSYYRDFLAAPFLIHQFQQSHVALSNVFELRYEALVESPKIELKRAYEWMGIPFNEDALDFGNNQKVKGLYGDDVYKDKPENVIVSNKVERWETGIAKDNRLRFFFREYQEFLTHDFLRTYGYEPAEIKARGPFLGKSDFGKLLQFAGNLPKLTVLKSMYV